MVRLDELLANVSFCRVSVRSRYAAPEEVISQLCIPNHLTIFSSSSTDELLANVSCSGYYSRATVDRVEVVRGRTPPWIVTRRFSMEVSQLFVPKNLIVTRTSG